MNLTTTSGKIRRIDTDQTIIRINTVNNAEINHTFAKVNNFLQQEGYNPEYTQGNPLSVAAGEPMHVRFTHPANPNTKHHYDVARHNLEYARLGFHVTQGQGFLSIRYTGEPPTSLDQALAPILDHVLGPVYRHVHGVNIHTIQGQVTINPNLQLTILTPEQALRLAMAIQEAAQDAF